MNWALLPLRRYVDFSGRSRRKEFWMFALLQIILYALALFVESTLGLGTSTSEVSDSGVVYNYSYNYEAGPIFWIIWLALALPNIGVTVRRFHDQDRTGWMILLGFIPFAGFIVLLVFMCLEGTRGSNTYGMDPKGHADTSSDVFS